MVLLCKADTGAFLWFSSCVNTKEQNRCMGKETSIPQKSVQPDEMISVSW